MQQPREYQNQVLPPDVTNRLAIEAASSLGWKEWVGDKGDVISIDRFGASAPGSEVMSRYGFNVDNVVAKAKTLVENA